MRPRCVSWRVKSRSTSPRPDTARCSANSASPTSSNGPARGARRADLAAAIPLELAQQLAALGTPDQVADRIRAYLDAGADTVAVIPVTAEDPAGRIALGCAADISRTTSSAQETAS